MYLGPTSKKGNEIDDESLLKCMKDYLECPIKYHPDYLGILLKDYERRIIERISSNHQASNISEVIKKLKGD